MDNILTFMNIQDIIEINNNFFIEISYINTIGNIIKKRKAALCINEAHKSIKKALFNLFIENKYIANTIKLIERPCRITFP